MKKNLFLILLIFIPVLTGGCKVSYGFNGASIDYDIIKTIQIHDFQNQALEVYAPLAQRFNEEMRDVFTRNTKLIFTSSNPDVEFEGEIIRWDFAPQAVKDDGYASETRLTMGVRVRYRNNKEPEKDREETFTAYRDFDANRMADEAQEELIPQLNKEIVDQIFNATMSDW